MLTLCCLQRKQFHLKMNVFTRTSSDPQKYLGIGGSHICMCNFAAQYQSSMHSHHLLSNLHRHLVDSCNDQPPQIAHRGTQNRSPIDFERSKISLKINSDDCPSRYASLQLFRSIFSLSLLNFTKIGKFSFNGCQAHIESKFNVGYLSSKADEVSSH